MNETNEILDQNNDDNDSTDSDIILLDNSIEEFKPDKYSKLKKTLKKSNLNDCSLKMIFVITRMKMI
jgi:hypothetical protein